jgi:hypothetical protein
MLIVDRHLIETLQIRKLMKKKFNLLLVFILTIYLFGCMSGTTNSSPKFSDNYGKVEDEIKNLSNSESVQFVDMATENWNNKVVKRELRIDLVKPKQFPSNTDLKNIILAVKSKLVEASKFTKYTVNEVEAQHGQVIVFPAENILKSVTINAEDL